MATALTRVATAAFSAGVADIGEEAADQPSSNEFTNDGKQIVLINNASGGNVTCTATGPASRAAYNQVPSKPVTVAAGNIGILGPFPPEVFGSLVTLAWDTGTSITVAVVTLTPPL